MMIGMCAAIHIGIDRELTIFGGRAVNNRASQRHARFKEQNGIVSGHFHNFRRVVGVSLFQGADIGSRFWRSATGGDDECEYEWGE